MFKKITAMLLVVLTLFSFVLCTEASSSEQQEIDALIPDISHSPGSYTVNEGSLLSLDLTFYRANIKDLSSFSFEITDYGDLTMVEGNEKVNNAELSKSYGYKFSVPASPAAPTVYLRYTVYFTYENRLGNEVKESKNFFSKIDIKSETEIDNGGVSIENAVSEKVSIGTESVINAQIVNTRTYTINNSVFQVLNDKGDILARKYIGKIQSLSDAPACDVSVSIPAYDTEGNKTLTLKLSYTDKNGASQSVSTKHDVTVSEDIPVSLKNFTPPAKITAGNPVELTFNLINKGSSEYKNAQFYFYKGDTLLHTEYIGLVPAQQQTEVKFSYTFSNIGSSDYKLSVVYENSAGKSYTASHSQKLTVNLNSPLEINNIAAPETVTTKTLTEIKFNLINKSETDFTNAEAFLYSGGTLLENAYIGAVTAQSQTGGVISYKFKNAGKGTYTLKISYNDSLGKLRYIEKKFELDIKPFEGSEGEAGALKIQTIVPPVEAQINSTASFMFSITNPTSASVKGVEVFVSDENGNQLNSIYISEIEANTSYTKDMMNFNTEKTEGVYSYNLRVIYKDADEKEYTLSKSFSVNTVVEKKEEAESEYPANIKIQKINNPSAIYTNVKTNIPVTIVNAGKGTAYNVELYVLNADGKEMAREYIGTIAAAAKVDMSYNVKYVETGEYDATLYVDYENADEKVSTAQKNYSQQVINYRASIKDIAGYEYIEMGYPINIEFAIVNSGTERLLNTNAVLTGGDGTKYSELYIGTIEPGTQKERQRFRNVMFNTPGDLELTVTITYENEDMQIFEFTNSVKSMVNQPYVPEMNMSQDGMLTEDAMQVDGMPAAEGGLEWWVIALIIGGGVIIVVVVIIIVVKTVRKKRREKSDEDDIEYYLSQTSNTKNEESK